MSGPAGDPPDVDYDGDCCDAPGCPDAGCTEVDGDLLCAAHATERDASEAGGLPGCWDEDRDDADPGLDECWDDEIQEVA